MRACGLAIVALLAAWMPGTAPVAEEAPEYDLRIERQPLGRALQEFAKQSGVQIIFFSRITDGHEAPSIIGRFTAASALRGLLSGSGLTYREVNAKTIEIQPKTASQPAGVTSGNVSSNARKDASAPPPIRMARAERSEAKSRDARTEAAAGAHESRTLSEVIVLGSRRHDRTVAESAVPIDVLQPEMIERTGYTDLNDALRSLVPSFNAQRLPLNDGSSFVRPITLRGSPADHVLLLMNGKRRHRSAIVQIGTGHATTSGSQGQDFNAIPPIALGRIEVLRDGAAAQYGSDAIAGVINLALKEDASGGALITHAGQYFEGDGSTIDVQGNVGLPLTERGFINLSGQYSHQEKTFRGGPHEGAEELRAAGVRDVPVHPLELGEPYYEALKLAWNSGLDFGEDLEGYFFGNYVAADSRIGFAYRQPLAAAGLPANASYADSAFDATPAHPETFDLAAVYPGGYVPQFSGAQRDFSTILGLKRAPAAGVALDLNARFGENEIDYDLDRSFNPSLGVASPRRFRPGSLTQRETEITAEASRELTREVLLFGGVSYRREEYAIGAGEPASYAVGPLRDLPAGANGFQGYSPETAGTFSTDSHAAFVELDAELTDRWFVAAAARYEDYQAFGDNFSYKVATRYALSGALALRAAASTGFRAPAAGQLFGTSQTSQISPLTNDFILDTVLRPGSPEARIFGSEPLVPETSLNLSAGLVIDPGGAFTATLDFYQIEVDDRLLLTPPIVTTPEQRAALVATGFPNGGSVQQVRYFRNQLDTRVRGFDIVGTYGVRWSARHLTELSLALNHNEQHLLGDTSFFEAGTLAEFEEGIPSWRGNLTVIHRAGPFDLTVRGVYYGEWKRRAGAAFLRRDATLLVDLELGYRGFERLDLVLGARNVFDERPPDRGPALRRLGNVHDNHSPYGVSGGYYYVGSRLRF